MFMQFLVEAVVVTAAGGVVGLLLGLGLVAVVTNVLGMPTSLSPGILASAFFCAVGVGLVFGLFPAMKAGRLNPVEALHYE